MVFPLIAVGVCMLIGKGMNEAVNSHEKKKARRAREVEGVTENNIPQGFAPQPALLFDLTLTPGEHLIATFAFTPCKWENKLREPEIIPGICAITMGIGHVTSDRILLFYDVKKMHWKSSWSGEQIETLGKYGSMVHS